MRICFVISTLEIGGAQTFLIRLANYLSENLDHEISIFNLNINRNNLLETKISQQIRYEKVLNIKGLTEFVRFKLRKYQLKEHLNKFKPDIINTHLYHADLLASKVKEKIPLVITDHGDYKNPNLKDKKKVLEASDIVVANSAATQDYLKSIFAIDSVVINLGYEISQDIEYISKRDLGIPEASFIYCMVARGIREKGWMEAIKAFVLHKFYEKSFFIFVGDGTGVDEIKEYSKINNIQNVRFVGNQIEPIKFLNISDVSVLPSYFESETLGLSLVESIFAGVPVIATNWGGLPQIVQHPQGDCGLLCSMKDGKANIQSLVECMNKIVEEYEKFKKNISHCQEKFSMEYCVNNYIKLFEKLL